MSATYRNVIEAPRWAGVATFIRDEAWNRRLELKIETERHWLCETTRFEVSGEAEAVLSFRKLLAEALTDYNKRLEKAAT